MSGTEPGPSAELISSFTSTTGGVMTDEVGAITGNLELLTRPTDSGIAASVRYTGAHDLYTVTGSPVRTAEAHQVAHQTIFKILATPGKVEDGNELPIDLTGT